MCVAESPSPSTMWLLVQWRAPAIAPPKPAANFARASWPCWAPCAVLKVPVCGERAGPGLRVAVVDRVVVARGELQNLQRVSGVECHVGSFRMNDHAACRITLRSVGRDQTRRARAPASCRPTVSAERCTPCSNSSSVSNDTVKGSLFARYVRATHATCASADASLGKWAACSRVAGEQTGQTARFILRQANAGWHGVFSRCLCERSA